MSPLRRVRPAKLVSPASPVSPVSPVSPMRYADETDPDGAP